jgi:TetR/AcrR family fatty acid metabolism transcriptional regulator
MRTTTGKRDAILAAAEKVFGRRGYAATTVDEIASDAGIAKGSVYNYFRSKHELFRTLCAKVTAGGGEDLDRLVREPLSASAKIERYLDQWFGRLHEYSRVGQLVLEFWATAAREQRKGAMIGMFGRIYSHSRAQLAAILGQGVDSGEFRSEINPRLGAALILAVVNGTIIQAILDPRAKLDESYLKAMKRGLLASLLAMPATKRAARSRGAS